MAKRKQDDEFDDLELDAGAAESAEDDEVVMAEDDEPAVAELDDVEAAEDADVIEAVEDDAAVEAIDDLEAAEDDGALLGTEGLEMSAKADDGGFAEDYVELDDAHADNDRPDSIALADDDDGGPPPDDLDDDEPAEPSRPRLTPKNTKLTLTLCFLNVLAALGFVFLLMLNFEKRQAYAYAVFLRDLELRGIGTEEDRQGATAAGAVAPVGKLSPESLKEAFSKRSGTVSSSEPFMSIQGGFTFSDYNQLSPEILQELAREAGIADLKDTLEKELDRYKSVLLTDIQDAAGKVVEAQQKAGDPAKQAKILRLLYPLCLTPTHVEKLEATVKATTGAALDKALKEATERRILADILLPVERFRPGDPDKTIVEEAADLERVKLDDLRDLMTRRLAAAVKNVHDGSVHFGAEWEGQKRWTIEKRQNAAFLLVSIACVRKPVEAGAAKQIEDQLLYPKGLERAQRVCGLYDFTAACKSYNEAIRAMESRVVAAIELDRDGFLLTSAAGVKRSESFADKHAEVIARIRLAQVEIRKADERIKELEQQRDVAKQNYEGREAHKAEVEKRIVQERAVTAKRIAELRSLQEQLHRALVELADSAENNALLLERIRRLSNVKGAAQ